MKRFNLLSFSLVLVFLFLSCDEDPPNPCIEPGDIVSKNRTVSDFHSIRLIGIGNILLTQGPEQSLRIETHEEIFAHLTTTVMDQTLSIDLNRCVGGPVDRLDIYITIPDIKQLSIEGVGSIIAQNDLTLDIVSIQIEGVGNIVLKGTANVLDIQSTGVGAVEAFDLTTNVCDVLIQGTGSVEVTVVDQLNATIEGAGNVYYRGNPNITSEISGTGSVIDAN
jgi:hypothetical protein